MTAALQRGDVELLQDLVLEGHGKHLLGKASWNDDVKAFLKELPSYLVSNTNLKCYHVIISNKFINTLSLFESEEVTRQLLSLIILK